MPSTELAVQQLATLQALHTRAVAVSVQPLPGPFAAPDDAETARREAAAAARTVSRIAYAWYSLSEVFAFTVDAAGRGRPLGPLSLDYAQSAYRSASDALVEAAQSLHLHTDHLAGRPDGPRNQYGAVRRAAARLRSAVRPAPKAETAASPAPAAPAPTASKPSPRR
ncbi:hypothetical protein ACFV6F_08890 [Kitasatospora phosalacinea]|uniref:hypothetical protein n=1 Tax=Kitasatospora phosalacinea TaxID=2065 RepID=UPI00364DEB82